ncbi:hypothetical protein K439DRAFT_488577 [Ramaria rubella]|nr:hypothetical protein K439DRAFT_488577 [Ramaria rubella]
MVRFSLWGRCACLECGIQKRVNQNIREQDAPTGLALAPSSLPPDSLLPSPPLTYRFLPRATNTQNHTECAFTHNRKTTQTSRRRRISGSPCHEANNTPNVTKSACSVPRRKREEERAPAGENSRKNAGSCRVRSPVPQPHRPQSRPTATFGTSFQRQARRMQR